jgi:hypothetical protein
MSADLKKLAKALDQIERRYPAGGRRYNAIVENPSEAGYLPIPKPSKRAVAKGRRLRKAMSGLSIPANYYFGKKAAPMAKVVRRKGLG